MWPLDPSSYGFSFQIATCTDKRGQKQNRNRQEMSEDGLAKEAISDAEEEVNQAGVVEDIEILHQEEIEIRSRRGLE